MAPAVVATSTSAWPHREDRRRAAASKLQLLEQVVIDLNERLLDLESRSCGAHNDAQPDFEPSPDCRIYTRHRLLAQHTEFGERFPYTPRLPGYCDAETQHYKVVGDRIIDELEQLNASLCGKLYETDLGKFALPSAGSENDIDDVAAWWVDDADVTPLSHPVFEDNLDFVTSTKQSELKASGIEEIGDLDVHVRELGRLLFLLRDISSQTPEEFAQRLFDKEQEELDDLHAQFELSDEEAAGNAGEFDITTAGGRRRAWLRDLHRTYDSGQRSPH